MFSGFAKWISNKMGRSYTFVCAIGLVGAWLVIGPLFQFSNTWQLMINTATTIITFLMVFVIQNTQNRDNAAMHIKLDEIVRAIRPANNIVMSAEAFSDEELESMLKSYSDLSQEARQRLKRDLKAKAAAKLKAKKH